MKCPKCGAEVEGLFCPECGTRCDGSTSEENHTFSNQDTNNNSDAKHGGSYESQEKTNSFNGDTGIKKFLPYVVLLMAAVVVIISVVTGVKAAQLKPFKNIIFSGEVTSNDVFEKYFDDGEWKYSKNGDGKFASYVGTMTYDGEAVPVELKFSIDGASKDPKFIGAVVDNNELPEAAATDLYSYFKDIADGYLDSGIGASEAYYDAENKSSQLGEGVTRIIAVIFVIYLIIAIAVFHLTHIVIYVRFVDVLIKDLVGGSIAALILTALTLHFWYITAALIILIGIGISGKFNGGGRYTVIGIFVIAAVLASVAGIKYRGVNDKPADGNHTSTEHTIEDYASYGYVSNLGSYTSSFDEMDQNEEIVDSDDGRTSDADSGFSNSYGDSTVDFLVKSISGSYTGITNSKRIEISIYDEPANNGEIGYINVDNYYKGSIVPSDGNGEVPLGYYIADCSDSPSGSGLIIYPEEENDGIIYVTIEDWSTGLDDPFVDDFIVAPEGFVAGGGNYDSLEENTGDYLVPGSDSGYFDRGYFDSFTDDELRIARNEILARHGRIFNSPDLQEYFNSKSWYNGTIDGETFDAKMEDILNDWEKGNIETIKSIEAEREGPAETTYGSINASDGYVNLRSGPGVDYDIICSINNGEMVEILGEELASNGKKWYRVAYWVDDGWNEGYVIASQVD